ncbi:MAG: hypothetical protein IJL18_03980 [Synergistaceae bacterium]|nr:hypothetical protein [Synergistaceae bacterium]MBQ6001996.1 hypothetical protein [Synergistaceae bacterium]
MTETLSERFVKSFDSLEDSQASASDYMAWQRWLYRKKLNEAGVNLPEIPEQTLEDFPGATEGERYLDIFEALPDNLKVDVLNYIDWLKMAEEAEDADDLAYCAKHYDDPGVISIHELMSEKV